MSQKLSIKIAGILIMVMVVIMAIFTFYFVSSRSENMEAELLSKGRIEALTGAKMLDLDSRVRPTYWIDRAPLPHTIESLERQY